MDSWVDIKSQLSAKDGLNGLITVEEDEEETKEPDQPTVEMVEEDDEQITKDAGLPGFLKD